MRIVGLDIGGANLKASDGGHRSVSVPFPLWQQPDQLARVLGELIVDFGTVDRLAITMTGELADCFVTRAEGVHRILAAVEQAAGEANIVVWCTAGEFFRVADAREFPMLVAAGNWHALATWAGRLASEGEAILVDLGSTTTDIIPLECGLPMTEGRTDPERMNSGELLYVGIKRTPLIGLLQQVEIEGRSWPLANELFATTWDAGLQLGALPPEPECRHTANGRPATPQEAATRLARQLCADESDLSPDQLGKFATAVWKELTGRIAAGIRRVRSERAVSAWILSGEGSQLLRNIVGGFVDSQEPIYDLGEMLGKEHAGAACAYALARLGHELD